MKKLLKNKKGFTLMEMLIVIAIIVILVAIAIPAFSSTTDSAAKATDAANFRAAEAAALVYDLDADSTYPAYFDADEGDFLPIGETTPTGYSKCAEHGDSCYIRLESKGADVKWSDGSTNCDGES